MDSKYKKILPEDVFITFFEREPTEAELWQGITKKNFNGNRPTGNNFIDLLAALMRTCGYKNINFYAKQMGVSPVELRYSIKAMSGIMAYEWIWRYFLLASREVLLQTELSITEVSEKLGFSSLNTFTRFFYRMEGMHPSDYRYRMR